MLRGKLPRPPTPVLCPLKIKGVQGCKIFSSQVSSIIINNPLSPTKSPTKSPSKSPLKKKRPPPGSPKKVVTNVVRKKISSNSTSSSEKNKLDDPDSGYKSPTKYDKDEVVRKLEEEDDEKIEEMIDDISTNEMFGSSILSMEN